MARDATTAVPMEQTFLLSSQRQEWVARASRTRHVEPRKLEDSRQGRPVRGGPQINVAIHGGICGAEWKVPCRRMAETGAAQRIWNDPDGFFCHDSPLCRRIFREAARPPWSDYVRLNRLAHATLVECDLHPRIKMMVADCMRGGGRCV